MKTRKEVENYLLNNGFSEKKLREMQPYDLFKAWLEFQGIIGFTRDIIDVVQATGVLKH